MKPREAEILGIAYRKYKSGDPLTDEEVNIGSLGFRELAEDLRELGPEFTFAYMDLYQKADAFSQFRWHRERDRKEQRDVVQS